MWHCQQPDLTEAEGAARAADFFLEDFPPATREAAEAAALMPLFNTLVLRMAMDIEADESEARLVYYIDQVQHMIRMGMVFWDYGIYRFADSAVRRLIARHIHRSDPKRFLRIHRKAAAHFLAEARGGAFLHLHLVPAVYHLAYSEPSLDPAAAGWRCCEWVQNSQKLWLEARWPEVRSSWQTGANDPILLQELIALIGREAYDRIASLLESFQSKMEVSE
jgi:hypothetical protein